MDLTNLALGSWYGLLPVGPSPILLVFNFIYVNSYLKGYLDVPVQSVNKLGFDDISIQQNKFSFKITLLKANFSGEFSQNNQQILGLFEQNNQIFNLSLIKTSNTSNYTINRPQTPKRPFIYLEEEIKIQNQKANLTLAGTLTYPNSTLPPLALVLLAHGSGGQDRDETIYEHKPFMVIADHLTRHNIAVMRYDERGIAKSTGDFSKASDVDFAEDILAGIQFARTHRVLSNVTNIGIVGHSKGGATALIAKNMSDRVKFMVLLGAMGIDGESILYLQTRLLLQVENRSEDYINKVKNSFILQNFGFMSFQPKRQVLASFTIDLKKLKKFYKTFSVFSRTLSL